MSPHLALSAISGVLTGAKLLYDYYARVCCRFYCSVKYEIDRILLATSSTSRIGGSSIS